MEHGGHDSAGETTCGNGFVGGLRADSCDRLLHRRKVSRPKFGEGIELAVEAKFDDDNCSCRRNASGVAGFVMEGDPGC